MPLIVDVLLHRGDFTLDASVTVADGETLALLGPNGSGKSTLLAAIAGLLTLERGHIIVNGRTLTRVGGADRSRGAATGELGGTSTAAATGRVGAVEPHARRVGLLGQDPLLFPHLSALENVAFGSRARGESAVSARQAASAWLDAVGLDGFASRLPTQLSGGQQQRVAIARALAAEPEVLLLDEPMAALDVQNASSIRTLLRERLGATALPTIVVSHDVVDAMVLADRVAIMDDGRIVDIGDPATVLGQPKNQFAANLVGLNLMHGTMGSDGAVHGADGRRLKGVSVEPGVGRGDGTGEGDGSAELRAGELQACELRAGESVIAAFPPSAVRVSRDVTDGHDGFSWRTTVGVLEPAVRGIRVPFVGETFAAELSTAELLSMGMREGMPVSVSVDPARTTVYRPRKRALAVGG